MLAQHLFLVFYIKKIVTYFDSELMFFVLESLTRFVYISDNVDKDHILIL